MGAHAVQDDRGSTADRRALHLALAFVSGAPALVYQVVWMREVGLVLGSQIEAISVVLVAFFGGLALGARQLGRRADLSPAPLRLYGILEVAAGALACGSPFILRAIGEHLAGRVPAVVLFAVAATVMFIITFLLGGTLPALLRSTLRDPAVSAREAGWMVGANTAGAVVGVVAAVVLVPSVGLMATILAAGALAVALGLLAVVLGRSARALPLIERTAPTHVAPMSALVVAAVGGVATIAFEVLAARTASLWLGSSLLAWGIVLVLFLVGLAAGNALIARRAARTARPAAGLGLIEVTAAAIVLAGTAWAVPDLTMPATGLTKRGLLAFASWVVPTTMLMGAAFPLFVRLGAGSAAMIGAAFGAVTAANTAGGIVGALLAPFVLLPVFGLSGSLFVCAAINAMLGLGLLLLATEGVALRRRLARSIVAAAFAVAAVIGARIVFPPVPRTDARLIHVSHGRQATAAVVRSIGRRDLFVDGDAEASSGGTARVTEELLGTLPLVLHEDPADFLEVGLGSGITLGTAARLPLTRFDCVEICASVIECAPYFAPANGDVGTGGDDRIRIRRGDGRAYLLAYPGAYDVVVANTLHPWSVGATGLYSREYFARIRRALRPGGVAAQWLPLERIDEEDLGAIVRTFYDVFPGGSVWWGAENLLVVGRAEVGSADPAFVRDRFAVAAETFAGLGIADAEALWQRRLGSADDVRAVLGAGVILTDDRPRLEATAALARRRPARRIELGLAEAVARRAAAGNPAVEPLLRWLESRALRAAGDPGMADRLEAAAEAAGLALARRGKAERYAAEAIAAFAGGNADEAERGLRRALAVDPSLSHARFSLAVLLRQRGDAAAARTELEQLVADDPDHADAWNTLGVMRWEAGDRSGARGAVDRALKADPFYPEALANAGLFALHMRDPVRAANCLMRLEAIDPRGRMPETAALRAALGEPSS